MKTKKGITLIALVITIVVMLLLVGVTVSVSLKGGLFSKANEATSEIQIAQEKKQLLTAALGALGRNGKVIFSELDNNLPDNFTKIEEGKYESTTGNKYQVTKDADIILLDESEEEEEPETPVTPPATPTIELNPETITGEIEDVITKIEIGTITATVSNVDGDLTWSITPTDSGLELVDTDNENVKKVTASKAVENATITVSYGTVSDTCSVTVTEKVVTQASYTKGQKVMVGTEKFYVIEDSDETQDKVTLLAFENIDTTNLVQSATAGNVAFSSESYWGEGTSPYDITEPETIPASHIAAKAAADYGTKLKGTGRLMTYNEVNTLLGEGYSAMIYGTETTNSNKYLKYWLCSAYNMGYVYNVNNNTNLKIGFSVYSAESVCGLRPVVEISKTEVFLAP